jgi:cephalosporin hydroxylase
MADTYKDIPGAMCDFEKFYHKIAKELPDNCRVVEVGVADGRSSIYLAETLHSMGKKFELVMVDNCDYGKDEQVNTIVKNIINSGLGKSIRFIQAGSLDASCKFPDNWAHFVFIDASHMYEETKADIRLWSRKVMWNHTLAGHDYNADEVNKAVNEVIPLDLLQVHDTEKNYGVWSMVKTRDLC